MHPDLLNNPTFLRYHETWQHDPRSLVFAPLADFFCQYKLFAEARRVCEAGVRNHPDSVLAHYSLARVYTYTREWHAARHEAQWILARISDHEGALEVLQKVEQNEVPVPQLVIQPKPVVVPKVETIIEAAGGSTSLDVKEIADRRPTPISVEGSLIAGESHSQIGSTMISNRLSCNQQLVTSNGFSDNQHPAPSDYSSINRQAATMRSKIKKSAPKPAPWQTVTMAKIYAQQGHYFKARTIYKTILLRDPQNTEAHAGLAQLEQHMKDNADA